MQAIGSTIGRFSRSMFGGPGKARRVTERTAIVRPLLIAPLSSDDQRQIQRARLRQRDRDLASQSGLN